jgi:DNA-binding CsgD family transcriptional regulator
MVIVKVSHFQPSKPINMDVVIKLLGEGYTIPQIATRLGHPITTLKNRIGRGYPLDHPVRVKVRENNDKWNKRKRELADTPDTVPLNEDTWQAIERLVKEEGKTLFEVAKELHVGPSRLNFHFKWRYNSPALKDGSPNPNYDPSMIERVDYNDKAKARRHTLEQAAADPNTIQNKLKVLTHEQWVRLLERISGTRDPETGGWLTPPESAMAIAGSFGGQGLYNFLTHVPDDLKEAFQEAFDQRRTRAPAGMGRRVKVPPTLQGEEELVLKAKRLLQEGSSPEVVGMILGLDMDFLAAIARRHAMDDPIFRPIIFPKTKMKTNLPLTGYERGRLQQQRTFTEVTPVTAAWLLPMCKFASGEVLEQENSQTRP